METVFNQFVLNRYPNNEKNLRAWDAADEYLINHLSEEYDLSDKKLLIFNDTFGALSISLNGYNPTVITDSYLSYQGIAKNIIINDISSDKVRLNSSVARLDAVYDLVLIKIPKSLDFLNDFLISLYRHIHAKTEILLAGMVKHIPQTLWKILEQQYGKHKTLPSVKKAKIIKLTYDKPQPDSVYPVVFQQQHSDLRIYNYSNVFSKNSLDIGTRFLLENLPQYNNIKNIADLGCGNGIVGLNLAIKYPDAFISFTDESFMAIESARLTLTNNIMEAGRFDFHVTDCLTGLANNSFDLIVNNPPFHQNNTISTSIAERMFKQSSKKLKANGILLVVANRHLPYFQLLKRIFRKTEIFASNRKFNLYQCTN